MRWPEPGRPEVEEFLQACCCRIFLTSVEIAWSRSTNDLMRSRSSSRVALTTRSMAAWPRHSQSSTKCLLWEAQLRHFVSPQGDSQQGQVSCAIASSLSRLIVSSGSHYPRSTGFEPASCLAHGRLWW